MIAWMCPKCLRMKKIIDIARINTCREWNCTSNYQRDQRHEIKLNLLFRFNKLKVSLNQVYGSGFNNGVEGLYFKGREPYSRFDLGMEYDLVSRKVDIDLGISVLNLFNAQNVRLNQFSSFPDGSITYVSGVPFTPSLNLVARF